MQQANTKTLINNKYKDDDGNDVSDICTDTCVRYVLTYCFCKNDVFSWAAEQSSSPSETGADIPTNLLNSSATTFKINMQGGHAGGHSMAYATAVPGAPAVLLFTD